MVDVVSNKVLGKLIGNTGDPMNLRVALRDSYSARRGEFVRIMHEELLGEGIKPVLGRIISISRTNVLFSEGMGEGLSEVTLLPGTRISGETVFGTVELIGYKDLQNIIVDTEIRHYLDSRSKIICLDSTYRIPKIETSRIGYHGLKQLLYGYDNIFEWKKNAFDCDKHSRVFKSYVTLSTIGFEEVEYALTIGMFNFYYKENGEHKGHSLNIIVYLEGGDFKIKLLEPQWLTSEFIRTYVESFEDEEDKIDQIFEYSVENIKEYLEDYDNVEIAMILF